MGLMMLYTHCSSQLNHSHSPYYRHVNHHSLVFLLIHTPTNYYLHSSISIRSTVTVIKSCFDPTNWFPNSHTNCIPDRPFSFPSHICPNVLRLQIFLFILSKKYFWSLGSSHKLFNASIAPLTTDFINKLFKFFKFMKT